ncbi:MAG: aminodeoxychorismate/anthranilate synthase component II [Acidobacteriota bacterium]
MILVVDNYDSFTYNLVQILSLFDSDVRVVRNDALTVDAILAAKPDRLVVSPGPGRPEDAGISCELIRRNERIPLLGVCLGHQALGVVFGGTVSRAPVLMHGKTSEIAHDGTGLFEGLPSPFTATRYHSLVVERDSVPPVLRITATTEDGLVMGLAHRTRPIVGVQFHPESILTKEGERLLKNFVEGRLA